MTARVFFFVRLFHKPPVLGIALNGFADTCDKLGSVQRTVEERVDVTRLVGSRKEVVNPPKVNLWIVPSLEVLVGKTRLYQYLPTAERKALPAMEFTDCHINTVAKAYYADENFSRGDNPEIDLWRVYNLFTGANKSSYIDTFLDRSLNATELITGIGRAIEGDAEYRWFVE